MFFVIVCRDDEEWWKYRKILNQIMLKDFNMHFVKSYSSVINDFLTQWESCDGIVVTNLIGDLYKISISCKYLFIISLYIAFINVYLFIQKEKVQSVYSVHFKNIPRRTNDQFPLCNIALVQHCLLYVYTELQYLLTIDVHHT